MVSLLHRATINQEQSQPDHTHRPTNSRHTGRRDSPLRQELLELTRAGCTDTVCRCCELRSFFLGRRAATVNVTLWRTGRDGRERSRNANPRINIECRCQAGVWRASFSVVELDHYRGIWWLTHLPSMVIIPPPQKSVIKRICDPSVCPSVCLSVSCP